jgi:hypothetical protein
VVLPARIADEHLGLGLQLLQEIGAHLQAAGAADGLDRRHALGRDGLAVGAEDQRLDGAVVGGDAIDGQIAARAGRLHHVFFHRPHAGQQRKLAVVVVIDAHAEIDLVGIAVGGILLVETQDRVARRHLDGGEHRHG